MTIRAKSLLLAIVVTGLLLGAFSASAQTFQEKNPFSADLSIAIDVGETITVETVTFPVLQNKNGKWFVKAISSKGETYPVWIYEETKHLYKNYKVYKTPKGNYCYYKLTNSGYPYPVWLDKE